MTRHGETCRDAASSEGTVIVTETSVGGYTQQIAAGPHRLVADEPTADRRRHRANTLRSASCRARCMYVDDGADVRRPQALAAGADQSDVAALANSRDRLRRLRNQHRLDRLIDCD